MPDHRIAISLMDDLGNWHVRCTCGRDFRRVSKRWSLAAHEAHVDDERRGT